MDGHGAKECAGANAHLGDGAGLDGHKGHLLRLGGGGQLGEELGVGGHDGVRGHLGEFEVGFESDGNLWRLAAV